MCKLLTPCLSKWSCPQSFYTSSKSHRASVLLSLLKGKHCQGSSVTATGSWQTKRCPPIGVQLQLSISAHFVLGSSEVQNSTLHLNIEFLKAHHPTQWKQLNSTIQSPTHRYNKKLIGKVFTAHYIHYHVLHNI